MSVTRATGRGAAAPEDTEEFTECLYKGGELLAAGNLEAARGHLERASELQPKNEKGQNLLGLTYFKLGMFERAAEVYELLVRENPVDPTLRVNLGLVYLKNSANARAIREFETAVDLQPDHVKAQNYLGLALAQAGEFGRAREHFLAAGSEAMAEKMARALSEASVAVPPVPPSVPKQRLEVAPSPQPEDEPPAEAPPEASVEFQEPPMEHHGVAEESFSDLDTGAAQEHDQGFEAYASADAAMSTSFDEQQLSPESADPERFAVLSEPPPPEATSASEWGAQFGFDLATAPAPADPFRAPAEGEPFVPPEVRGGVGEDLRFAEDEGPSASDATLQPRVEPRAVDVALEVAAISAPAEDSAGGGDTIVLSESMAEAEPSAAPEPELEAELHIPTAEASATAAEAHEWMSERPAAHLRAPSSHASSVHTLAELALRGQLSATQSSVPFARDGDVIVLTVQEELVSRCEGLIAYQGDLHVTPEYRRFRGRPTDQPMGLPSRPMSRVTGHGILVVEAGASEFIPLRLDEVAGYFREDVLFAFEESLTFENGRLTSDFAAEVELVHLSGEGQLLLKLPGDLRSLEVRPESPLTVPLSRWVGWYGNLAPKVVALPFALEGMEAGVELSGEGHVLLSAESDHA